MDKELHTSFNNINKRLNLIDEKLLKTCDKIDSYHSHKNRQIISALVGSPILAIIATYVFTTF